MHPYIQRRSRAGIWRRAVPAGAQGTPPGYGESLAALKPRCLGELRLADLLRDGAISRAEFEAERAALLKRL